VAAPKTSKSKRSGAGQIAAAAIGLASATGVGVGLWQDQSATPPAAARVVPDPGKTPGVIDPTVTDPAQLCAKQWAAGPPGQPPVKGGSLTYSQAARVTPESLKNQVFADYGLSNPHDGGKSYEIDHLVPLSLGGRDVESNLWPQSRTAQGLNAWVKDALESRLYHLICNPKPGDPAVSLPEVQTALRTDWPAAYQKYCVNGAACEKSDVD
jgi:hypothetical protein